MSDKNKTTERMIEEVKKMKKEIIELNRKMAVMSRTTGAEKDKYQRLVENLKDEYFFYAHNIEGVFEYISPSITSVLGYSVDEFFTHYETYMTDSPRNKEVHKHTNQSLKGIKQPPYEVEIYHKDGSIHILEVMENPVFDDSGKVVAVEGIAHDVTHKMEDKSELLTLKSAIEQSANAIIITDKNKLIEYVNPKFTELTGYSFDEVKGRNPRFLKSGFTPTEEYKKMWVNIFSGQNWKGVFHNKKKDGTFYWASGMMSPVMDDSGNITHIIGIQEDITARKEMEMRLKESEQRFRKSILNAPFPMMIHADNGEVVQINNIWTELTGYTHDEIPTLSAWTEKAYGEKKDVVKTRIDKIFDCDGRVDEGEYFIKSKNGKELIWDFSSASLGSLPDGRRLVISIARDVTELKKTQEEIIKLSKFPSENPNPILRMSSEGNFIYKNDVFMNILEKTGVSESDCERILPKEVFEISMKALNGNTVVSGLEVNVKGQVYSYDLAPVKEMGYVNLYGKNITALKKVEEVLKMKVHELEVFHDAAVNQEMQIIELKREVNNLLRESKEEVKYKETAKMNRDDKT